MLRSLIVVVAGGLVGPVSAQFEKTEKKTETVTKTETKAGKAGKPLSQASTGPKTPAALPGEVEINFLNGSTVRMLLESDKLEIATPYGQLSVPSTEIRGIEFGLHFPEGTAGRIDQAIKGLGAGDYRERDQAGKSLIEMGPYSYPAVLEASRLNDLEISRRAKELVKQLQARHPKKDLKIATEDRVITPTFTVVGRILTPTIKAKAELFGQVDLPVTRMRALRALSGASLDMDVTIDAAKYANVGQWLETDYHVDGRTAISITAKGLVDTWPQQGGQYIVGPNGLQGRGMGGPAARMIEPGRKIAGAIGGQMYGGMLLGKIGEDGEPFTIGERYDGAPETEGKLYLHIGPSPWNNSQSSGSYDVKIARKQ